MTDTLWGIAHGKALEKRYFELFKPEQPEETRTAEEIIERISQKLRGGEAG